MNDVVAFLEAGGSGEPVERVDTHGAHVFLGRRRAWKMKRPVKFRFLDFSSLKQREQIIRTELDLNRRTAPAIYRAVMPVVRRADGRLEVDGEGEPVEWLLEMERFDRDDQLDRMADRGLLPVEVIEKLARNVARFHREAAVVADGGGFQGLAEVVEGNSADLMDLCPHILERTSVEKLDRFSQEHLRRHCDLLERRRAEGKVRHCHGDLHLGNVVLLQGEPTPFDCLEFDAGLASVDVIYDLAFLIMDLLHRGLPGHAHRALQGWLEVSEDDEAVALLPLCLATRAAVRAKIEGLQGHGEAARAYLALALRSFEERPAVLVALGGVSGTGKTSLARGLAPDLGPLPGAVILRSDVIRKRMHGIEPEQKLAQSAYSPEVSEQVFRRISERATGLLASGHAAIADAVYGEPDQRQAIETAAAQAGKRFLGLWLTAPREVLAGRIGRRRNDASDATTDVLDRQLAAINRDQITWKEIDASGDQEATLANAREALRSGG
ncbi:MAG TPA: AAA family ATPase [Geminicoccus sp.]|uniref:bifunctional aminoglycoside phosphotransferase/ATP-binding protein n=1 Tax=Geminicoccus sp. TaxID=2024832 RepID=UPI002E31DBD9|nr:AAA family ATPase [Geminicoccus sp.]HEX2528297.1 AAA family ATPase [Geminicoccus sp.]